VTLPVFKTGGRPDRATVCSTHTHFRHPPQTDRFSQTNTVSYSSPFVRRLHPLIEATKMTATILRGSGILTFAVGDVSLDWDSTALESLPVQRTVPGVKLFRCRLMELSSRQDSI
jgi:hypothetical protein